MTTILSIANKLMSLRGQIDITDEQGALAYRARGEFSFTSPTWRVYAGEEASGAPMATIRRRMLTWVPTWDIGVESGAFQIKRKVFSWTRTYRVVGGDYDGALIKGNVWDLNFTITRDDQVLATAAGKILSLRDRHRVEIHGEAERFVVLAMLVLQISRAEDADAQTGAGGASG
jgi:uncharacterized protein YxjI